MWTNNSKGNKDKEIGYENSIFKRIEEILEWKITIWELVSMNEKKGFKTTIDNILNKYADTKKLAIFIISEVNPNFFTEHKDLHADIDIIKLAIQKDSNLFYSITSGFKKDENVWLEVIKSMVRENKNFYEIEKFINNYFLKDNKKLFDNYFKYLEDANNYYTNDLSKNLFSLKKLNKELYDFLHKNKLFTTKWKNIIINNDFIKNFEKEISKDELFISLNIKEKEDFIINKLNTYFLISNKNLTGEEKNIFDLVLNLINIEVSKKIKETKKKDEDTNIDNDSSIDKKKGEENSETKDDEEDFNDFIDFSYPECNSYRISGWYNIETITWKNIFISNDEKDNFTTKALKNYIKFYNTLYNLWLNFLWDKYSHDFKILCANKFWFDYLHSEWITDSKMLSILNMIWRNIWIPEHKVINETWKETNQIECFKTLWDARNAFTEIKETWTINEIKYSHNSFFWNWAVENKLIEVFCIDQKGNWLNISKWR